jgi:hypothetical protein
MVTACLPRFGCYAAGGGVEEEEEEDELECSICMAEPKSAGKSGVPRRSAKPCFAGPCLIESGVPKVAAPLVAGG